MADVFLSYASADRARIAPLAKALANAGFTLWWDRDISPGKDFSETIEREITTAKAVVVAWSDASVRSQWVRDEATHAHKEGKLIPVHIDAVNPPMGFRQIQALDFGGWRGDPLSPAFVSLAASLRDLLARDGGSFTPIAPKPLLPRRARYFASPRRVPFVAAFALVAGVLGAWAFLNSSYAPGSHGIVMGQVEVQPFVARPPSAERTARAASYAGAFRQRFTELGIRNSPPSELRKLGESELILVGEVNDEGGKSLLTVRIDDRKSGATLWSALREPTEDAAWESNLAAFALKCALKRRDPKLGADVFSHYIYGCAHFLERDFGALHAVAKELYTAAPTNPNVLGFYAFAHVGVGWSSARSRAEHDRLISEGVRLAEMALKLDPHNADAMFTMGFAKDDFQFAEQEKWWRRALEADPELAWALGRYANLLTAVGRVREAVDMGLRAQLHRRVTDVAVAQLLASTGELQEAKKQYDLVRPMDPEQVGQDEMATEVFYGDIDAAQKRLRDQSTLGGRNIECWTQILAARRKAPVDSVLFVKSCGASGEFSVRAFALAGNLDAAYQEMDLYLKSGERFVPHLFWPEMHDFLRDPRFWPLAVRVGLVDYWLGTKQWPDFCAEPDLPFRCNSEAEMARAAYTPARTGVGNPGSGPHMSPLRMAAETNSLSVP